MLSGGDRLYNYRNPPSTVDKATAEVKDHDSLTHLQKYEVKKKYYGSPKTRGVRGYRVSVQRKVCRVSVHGLSWLGFIDLLWESSP